MIERKAAHLNRFACADKYCSSHSITTDDLIQQQVVDCASPRTIASDSDRRDDAHYPLISHVPDVARSDFV
jgi:hypothetical protein